MTKDDKDWMTRLIDKHQAEEAALDAAVEAATPEERAARVKNYPEGRGTWTKNPYLD